MENIKGELSLGIADFNKLISENMIYVDKTPFIKQLLDHKKTYYFLSRPRRFGKTLFLSTLENFFKGRKELFKNTYIYDSDWKWEKYPIINISMKEISNKNPEVLEEDLLDLVETIAEKNNVKLTGNGSYVRKFTKLIEKISNKNIVNENKANVVVLVDEYDAPILSNLDDSKIADKNRKILQEFYNVLKESEKYLKFVFITGLSKFTKVSVFSTFNNLTELSLDKDYSTICGITHSELEDYYHKHIQFMADENNYSYKETVNEFNHYYDGYSWDGINKVFNPYSTLSALDKREFKWFWFSTGTPRFIAEIFKKKEITEDYFKPIELKETKLDAIEPNNINETTLLFQAGYLTIEKEFSKNDGIYYSLKIPNLEVETAFKDNLTEIYLNDIEQDIIDSQNTLWESIKNADSETLANYLEIQFNESPYQLNINNKRERWKVKQVVFLNILNVLGFKAKGEKSISQGRMDAIFRNKNYVVVAEVKYTQNQKKSLDELVNTALDQIYEKRYYHIYEKMHYHIILLALAFKDVKINKKDVLTEVKCKIELLKT